MANLTFNPVTGDWVNLDKPGGQVFFVGGGTVAYRGIGASAINKGLTPQRPFVGTTTATTDGLNAVMDRTVDGRGDTIVLLPGSITNTAVTTIDQNDVTLTGVYPTGNINPSSITINAAIDGINVTGTNVVIENLHFPAAGTASQTAVINVAAAGVTVRGCTFACGANNLDTITIAAAGLHTVIEKNKFYVEANGPDSAVVIENAAAHFIEIKDNIFNGQNTTNSWDEAAVESAVAHLSCLVTRNHFIQIGAHSIEFSAAATGIISNNFFGNLGVTLGNMIDPGSCMCFENYEADAVDQSGRLIPTTVAS
jgi:hypothetical protein